MKGGRKLMISQIQSGFSRSNPEPDATLKSAQWLALDSRQEAAQGTRDAGTGLTCPTGRTRPTCSTDETGPMCPTGRTDAPGAMPRSSAVQGARPRLRARFQLDNDLCVFTTAK